jgi:hypothetical protein
MDAESTGPDLFPPEPELNPAAEALASHLRSLTRLILGGAEVGLDELLRLLQVWEAETARLQAETAHLQSENTHLQADAAKLLAEGELQAPGSSEGQALTGELSEKHADRLRYAFIGWLFESEAALLRRASLLGRPEGAATRWMRLWARPAAALQGSPLFSPFRGRLDRWAARGEREVRRWIALGREEEAHSRLLARVAFDKTVDEYIEYLTTNPEVKDLVQMQSTGLANEVIEEVRERTVSADTFLEGLARSLLHRLPRRQLPGPPSSLTARAAPSRHLSRPEKKH